MSLGVQLTRHVGRRIVAATAAVGIAAGMLVALTQSAGALPPKPKPVPKVTAAQVQAASQNKQQLATLVGQLSAQVAQAHAAAQQARAQQQFAEQKVALTQSRLEAARQAREKAREARIAAQAKVDKAHARFVRYIQASYMSGDVDGMGGALLTATDPSALLRQGTLARYQAQHQAGAIGNLEAATVARSNAEAKERRAVVASKIAKKKADKALAAATAQAQAAAAAQAEKERQAAAQQALLNQASLQLATLNNQRSTYLTYLQKKAEYEKAKREAEERARREAAARAAARRAAERAAQQASQNNHHGNHHDRNGSGGGGGGGGSSSSSYVSPSGGSWSAKRGRHAAERALRWLGETYIWAGGNAYGPTDGGCTDPIAPCGVTGFDCSGLTLYAWAPYTTLAHYTVTQYYYAGSYHPSPGNFRKGDLLFWGTSSNIHHVAIYIGHGDVVQAPQSGDIVRITPWDQVSYDYFGATRPMT